MNRRTRSPILVDATALRAENPVTWEGPPIPKPLLARTLGFVPALLVCGALAAQTTGRIEGTVRAESGVGLPGATIEITSASLQGTRVSVTTRDGVYRFPAAPPGEYRVRASLPGFKATDRTATVSLDSTTTVDFSLLAAAEEQVVVSGKAPIIDATSTTTGTSYTSQIVTRLPVSRNYADIVRSNPGVDQDRGETQGRSLALTVYGATSAENQWIIDGVNTTNVIKGSQGKAINNEFVEEVEVKTGGYQAEYGRALGGVINVITKSGGNKFHGDGFFYYDSQSMRADPVVTPEDSVIAEMRIADYNREDFGADLGGFVVKDRLWFFAAYNRVELSAKVSRYVTTPYVSADDRFPLVGADNLYSGKLTWNIASGSTLVGTIFGDPTTNTGAAGSDPRQGFAAINVPPITNRDPTTWSSTRTIGGQDYGLRLNQVFGSSALATLQASRHQDSYSLTAPNIVRTDNLTCQGGTPDNPCARPLVPNVQTGGYGFIFGSTDRNKSHRDQFRGDVSLFPSNHEIKAGGDYQNGQTDAVTSITGGQYVEILNEQGKTYYRHSLYAVSPVDLTPVTGVSVRPRTQDLGAYLQDSWKPAPGWTINVGLRWDDERIRDYLDQTVIHTSIWEPRVGVVWDPWKDGATKVYAFAGRFSYALPTNLAARSYGDQTFVRTYNFDPVSIVQDPMVPGHPKQDVFGGAFGDPVDRGLRAIYQDELTIGVERLLDPTFTVALKGTYRRLGNAIEDRCDLDYTRPETNFNSCGIMNPGSSGAIARGDIPGCNGLDGNFYSCGDTIPATPPARRVYRGIEVLARKSWGDRLWAQASYVFSSLRGNYDGEISNGYFGQTDPGINADFDYPAGYHDSYGRLFLDRPHRFRLDGYYVTRFRLSIGLQAYVSSGPPLNMLGYFNQFYGSYVQLVPKGYAGRLPPEWDANLTLAYPISLGLVTVTLQAYVYSLFNNQTPTSHDTALTIDQPSDYPTSLYSPNQPQNNPEYGKVNTRLEPRYYRAAIRVSF